MRGQNLESSHPSMKPAEAWVGCSPPKSRKESLTRLPSVPTTHTHIHTHNIACEPPVGNLRPTNQSHVTFSESRFLTVVSGVASR